MSALGCTPGPWKVGTSRNNRRQVSGENGKQIALIWRHPGKESHANECVISAALELYAACVEALGNLIDEETGENFAGDDDLVAMLRAAIAKAGGAA